MGNALTIGEKLSMGGGITLIGMGVVFTGLLLLILITWLMSKLTKGLGAPATAAVPAVTSVDQAPQLSAENKGELSAVIAASIATAMNTDVRGLRIHSIKKVD